MVKKMKGQTYPSVDPLRRSHPQISETHPILRQHRIHIRKAIHFKSFIERLPSHIEFKTLIKFTKKCVLMWKMNA
jgi:hypothetical protein